MRIAIAGASCFIGKKLVQAASNKNWDVIAIVRDEAKASNYLSALQNVNIVECSMNEYENLGNKLGCVDCFVYLTWDGTRGEARNDNIRQEHSYRCGIAAVKSVIANGCKKIITAGSQAEYGLNDVCITENMSCRPNTQYGIWKLKFYEDVLDICSEKGVSLKEPRFFSLYGPDDYAKTLIISMIDNMINNNICNMTECTQMWDYLYIDDAIEALLLLCEKNCADGVYNFGSGDTRILKEYIEEIKAILNSSSKLNYGSIPYPDTGMVSIWPDVSKLKKETGWKSKTSFRTGIISILKERFCLELH